MTCCLVTGGAGFIGSNLVEALLARGDSVTVFDNFSTGSRMNLAGLEAARVVEGDLRDLDSLRAAVDGMEVVFHHAAQASVTRSVENPVESNRNNLDGTVNVLIACRDAKVRRVVYAGSSSAYGESATLPKVETMREDPVSPYGVNKLAGEHYCRVFSKVYGLETVVLRYFNIFGPKQDPSSPYSGVISLFVTRLLAGEPPVIYGDGEQSRDFTYVANVVQANLKAAEGPVGDGRVFNIACGRAVTVNELFHLLRKLTGAGGVEPRYAPPRQGDVRHSLADISRAREELGYAPEVELEEGLRRTVDWYRAGRA